MESSTSVKTETSNYLNRKKNRLKLIWHFLCGVVCGQHFLIFSFATNFSLVPNSSLKIKTIGYCAISLYS